MKTWKLPNEKGDSDLPPDRKKHHIVHEVNTLPIPKSESSPEVDFEIESKVSVPGNSTMLGIIQSSKTIAYQSKKSKMERGKPSG